MASSSASRSLFGGKLNALLEIAGDEGFIQLLWATDALQSGYERTAAPFLANRYPKEAVTSDLASKMHIHKWELETLANELFVVPKKEAPKRGRVRQLALDNFNNVANLTNLLRKLENAEDGRRPRDRSILREMARIANRQFDWQRGYFNTPQFYRNAFVYGQGACAEFFERQHGITINQLSLVGFAIYSSLVQRPVFARNSNFGDLGIAAIDLERCLSLIARPIGEMRALATVARKATYHTAYRASVLRRFPCISFGNQNERVRSPLPQLVLERVTGGVFYDVIGGGGAVRADYGHRFEEYCLNYLRAVLPEMGWSPEEKYRVKPNQLDTPDILLPEGGGLGLVIECKATRMGYDAKFGDGDERGFEDIIKAVFQLWRFFSHCRRGLTRFTINPDAIGAVLTLDNWLLMANELQADVVAAAGVMADAKDPQILQEDRRPVAFFSVTSLEATLVRATPASFLQAVRACARLDRYGWMLSSVHDEFQEPDQPAKRYPFRDDIARLLPWYGNLEEARPRLA